MSARGQLLNITAAAKYSGLSTWRLRELVRHQEIAYVRARTSGRGRLSFFEQDLDAYLESKRTPAKAEMAKAELPRSRATATPDEPLAEHLPPMSERRYA